MKTTMQQQPMKDPAAGVPRELLPHLHLISKNRYPVNNSPSLETIVAYLVEATKVVRESQPVQWQFLDCPQDGTLFLTWQPQDLGMSFASDGYVWADQEAPFNSDVRGYTLQMMMHKSGFRPQGEAMASHCRRRYRLLPSPQSMAGGAMPDATLWLVHYSKAGPRDHIAAASIPVAPPVHAQLQQRRMIMSAGAIARKEFMLHDRSNWPTINLPGGLARHAAVAPGAPNAHRRGQSLTGHEPTLEEEEDVSRGDALDFMTPRDISRMRYEQHHEWMEEILESPYRTMQIIPPDLGLGRKGELEALTKGFFDAPTGAPNESSTNSSVARVGRLEPGKAEEFTKLANQKLANMQLELQKMKQIHQKRMEKLRKVTALSSAEKRLRAAPSEFSQRKGVANGISAAAATQSDPVDEVVKEIEESTGKKIDRVSTVTRIAKGGHLELQPAPASAPEQSHSATTQTKPSNNVPTVPVQHQSQQHQTQSQNQPSPPPLATQNQNGVGMHTSSHTAYQDNGSGNEESQPTPDNNDPMPDDGDVDINMDELHQPSPAEDGVGDTNDWVMVDDTNMGDNNDMDTPLDDLNKSIGDHDQGQADDDQTPLNTGVTPNDSETPTPQMADHHSQGQDPGRQPTGHTPLDTADFDFDDVNTAGDALADYGADDDLNLDAMDDSAFGDAFHPPDDHDLS